MKELWELAESRKTGIIACVVLASLGGLLAIVPYGLIFGIIDTILRSGLTHGPGPVLTLVGWGALALFLRYILVVASFVFSHVAAFNLLFEIRIRLASHLGRLPMGFWSRNNSGRVRKIIQEDVESIENFVAHHLPDTVSGLVLPTATLIYLYFMDWRLGLMATLPLPLGLILVKMMWSGLGTGRDRQELMKEYHVSLEAMHAASVEYVRGMPVVKVFGLTASSFRKLKESVLLYRKLVIQWSKGMTPYWAAFTALVLGGGVFILPMGLYLLQAGSIEVSTLLLFLLLGTGCFTGYVGLVTICSHMEIIAQGARRIRALLDEEPLPEPETPRLPEGRDIRIQNLTFRYGPELPDVLKNVSADFPAGSFTAVVGPSGAGKTTLVHLISRMWDPSDGEILVGGVPLADMGTAGVNRTVGTLFQDVRMLTDTVEANIRMSEKGASRRDIEEAARAAACHDFIMQLPEGYDTVIGDGGSHHLSGGEKQRIALARVILKQPPIVLLDEATSYADADNEALVQEAFSRVMADKTVLVIAHRLSTIVQADQILVVDGGRIVERGQHDELLFRNGLYRRMWDAHIRAGKWSLAEKEAVV